MSLNLWSITDKEAAFQRADAASRREDHVLDVTCGNKSCSSNALPKPHVSSAQTRASPTTSLSGREENAAFCASLERFLLICCYNTKL